MIRIAIILGSTRPNRKAPSVAQWILDIAREREDAHYEIVDIADFDLPFVDEPLPPSRGKYEKEHTKKWAAAVESFDGFVFVTPEYNRAISGALKNAIDFIFHEWNNKAAGFVGYGSAGGTRAVENLRLIMAEIQIADVCAQVALSLREDFENCATFNPRQHHAAAVNTMLDQLLAWATALKPLREPKS